MTSTARTVSVVRTAEGRYLARNAEGVELAFGAGAMSAVDLLMIALAGCSASDVDVATSRHAEPERFTVTVQADKLTEGGNRLENISVAFDVAFGEGRDADKARAILPRALRVSHDTACTVSRTIEAATPVQMHLV